MTNRDKIGVVVILGLMALLGGVLLWTLKPVGGGSRGYDDNVFIQQRSINVQK